MSGESNSISTSGTWLPLKSLLHGHVIQNHLTTEETRSINPHSIDLWCGSEVYAFEVFVDDLEDSEAGDRWLRGYVLGNPSLVFHPPPATSTKDDPSPTIPPEPTVFIGIFPSRCIQWDQLTQTSRGSSSIPNFEIIYEPTGTRGTGGPPIPVTNPPPSHRRSSKKEDDELILPLIRETVERWVSLLPNLLAKWDYKTFHQSTKDIRLAVSAHRQLGSTILTRNQRERLKRDVIRRSVLGDERLGLNVIVRHPETGVLPVVMPSKAVDQGGWTITPLRAYLAEVALISLTRDIGTLSKEEERLAELYLEDPGPGIPSIQTIRTTLRGLSSDEKTRAQSRLLAQVKAMIIPTQPGESLELFLSAYDAVETKKAFVTEEFVYQATAGGHIVEKASVVFDLPELTTPGGSFFLIIKVVRVVEVPGGGGWRRYPFGIAVTPLSNIVNTASTGQQLEKVYVVPWTSDKVFASMHEGLIGASPGTDCNKHRIVIGMQMSSHTQATRQVTIARSLSGPSPSTEFSDVYIKLWFAVLPEPVPTEVYVKMTFYSADHHRLVDCLFPGGSGTATEGDLEYRSILWQKSPTGKRPVFGDLVRFRVSRNMLETGFIRFSVIAIDRNGQGDLEAGGEERIVFNAELPLCQAPGQELWREDGEHTLASSQHGCTLIVRSLSLVSFGFKDPNIAYVLGQSPNDVSIDPIALLSYAPAGELERQAPRLMNYLLSVMLGEATNTALHSVVLDILARVASTLDTGTDTILAGESAEAKERASVLILEAISLALTQPDKRNATIKAIGRLLNMTLGLSPTDDSTSTNVFTAIETIRKELFKIVSAKDDPIGYTLLLKHWPFSTFFASEDIIKLIDYTRADSVTGQKAKLGFMFRALEEIVPDESLTVALWRNIKDLLENNDRERLQVLQLSISLIARMIDRITLEGDTLAGVLDYIGIEMLQSLFVVYQRISGPQDHPSHQSGIDLRWRLASETIQQPEHIRLSLVIQDLEACMAALSCALLPLIGDLLMDLEEEEAVSLRDTAWSFFRSIFAGSSVAFYSGLLTCLGTTTWLSLCRAICQRTSSIAPSSISITPIIALVRRHPSADGPYSHLAETAEDDAVAILEYIHQNHITPRYFEQIVDLALISKASKIREVCHQAIRKISFGGPNVAVEAFLWLLVQAFDVGSHRITQITKLVQEASAIWLTEENGWGPALEALPLLYDAMESTGWIQPLSSSSHLLLLDLVTPFPLVKRALLERLYGQIFECDGASTANILLDLALICHDPDQSLFLRLHGRPSPVKLRAEELHEAAVNEAVAACDMGLAARILASLTVVAEREGDYHRMSEILAYRAKLARTMQESSPAWRYFLMRSDVAEPVEVIWRARTSVDLLLQIQEAFPQSHIALRERSDHSPIPTGIDVIIHEVDIEDAPTPATLHASSPTPTRSLWAKHDNLAHFTRDLVDGDLEVYSIDPPFPGIFPFSQVRSTSKVVQTEEEVVARRIRGKTEELQVALSQVIGTDDSNGLSDLLDASIDDPFILTHLNAGYETLIIPYLSLLSHGLDVHRRLTRGTPMGGFHETLVKGYNGRFSDELRERAKVGIRRERREGGGLLGMVFDGVGALDDGQRGGGRQGDRPSEETLVHGRMGMFSPFLHGRGPGLPSGSSVMIRSPTTIGNSESPRTAISPLTPKVTSPKTDVSRPWESSGVGSGDRPGSISVSSRRLPMGLKRLGSILGGRRRGSESSTVVSQDR